MFADWHAPIPDLVAATSAEEIKATDIYDCRPLRAWSRGRVVLVGDAAHPSMPHMGQGTSQAFEDAAVLAACLAAKRDVGVALAAYEASRRRRARAAWSQARMLARLGGWRSPMACWLRERMLSAVPSSVQLAQLRHLFRWTPA
ncbi:MAG: FAD-dependent monooxygenase [Chloroflexi bacterium]|nr:FAD-dependent monooxygenase [Acidobacteriota bacterium]MCA1587971.1 FAD-dependent monooxygenase [Chloroflexota bacterium]